MRLYLKTQTIANICYFLQQSILPRYRNRYLGSMSLFSFFFCCLEVFIEVDTEDSGL